MITVMDLDNYKKDVNNSIERFDGFEDGLWNDYYRAQEELEFVETFDSIESYNIKLKLDMLNKINKAYGKCNRGIENYCRIQSLEAETDGTSALKGEDNDVQDSSNDVVNSDAPKRWNEKQFTKILWLNKVLNKIIGFLYNLIQKLVFIFRKLKEKIKNKSKGTATAKKAAKEVAKLAISSGISEEKQKQVNEELHKFENELIKINETNMSEREDFITKASILSKNEVMKFAGDVQRIISSENSNVKPKEIVEKIYKEEQAKEDHKDKEKEQNIEMIEKSISSVSKNIGNLKKEMDSYNRKINNMNKDTFGNKKAKAIEDFLNINTRYFNLIVKIGNNLVIKLFQTTINRYDELSDKPNFKELMRKIKGLVSAFESLGSRTIGTLDFSKTKEWINTQETVKDKIEATEWKIIKDIVRKWQIISNLMSWFFNKQSLTLPNGNHLDTLKECYEALNTAKEYIDDVDIDKFIDDIVK